MLSRVVALVCVPVVLALVGCSAAGAGEPPAASVPIEGDRASTEVLPECEGFIFDEGEEVAGSVVAACVIATMVVHNHGKMTVESTGTNGLTIFRQAPEFAARVEIRDETNTELFIDGDEMWLKDRLGWVRAQQGSDDMRAQFAYTVGSSFRGLSDPRVAVSMLEKSATWTIVGEEEIERPDTDTVRNAWRIDATPFEFGGVQISELSLWLDNSYTTLQQDSVSSAMGVTARTLNRYYDWGVVEEFTSPAE